MASMEHPFFSLSKKPELSIRRYENGDRWVEVVPSVKGLATIYDKDILIYCISQLVAKINNGDPPLPLCQHRCQRPAGVCQSLARRQGLRRIGRSVATPGRHTYPHQRPDGRRAGIRRFGLIEAFKLRRSDKTGRILEIAVKLSDWVFRSIAAKEVLTLHKDYFRLEQAHRTPGLRNRPQALREAG